MNVGEKIYYVNSGRMIDEYTITDIDGDNIHVKCHICADMFMEADFNLRDFTNGKCVRLFTDYNEAVAYKTKLDQEFEERRQQRFEEILEEALQSVTLDEVEKFGIILKEKQTDYEAYYSDSPGGTWTKAVLYLYEGKQYVIVHKYIEDKDGDVTKRCLTFSERK